MNQTRGLLRRFVLTSTLAALLVGSAFAIEFAWDQSETPLERIKGTEQTSVLREAKHGFITGAVIGVIGGVLAALAISPSVKWRNI